MNDRRYGIDNGDRGEEKIAELEDFKRLITIIDFEKRGWKPIQTGVVLSTTTTIDLHTDLVRNGPFRDLLPGRLTIDCIENLFSQVRQVGNHHPGPVETRNALRLISTAQFFYVPRSSNYEDEDDGEYIVDVLKKRDARELDVDRIKDANFADPGRLTVLQEQGLYKTAGWVVRKVTPRGCETCLEIMESEEPLADCPSEWTIMLSRGGLIHPSLPVYRLIQVAETVFNALRNTLLHCKNPVDTAVDQILEHVENELRERMETNCQHNMLLAVVQKFLQFRIYVLADDRTRRISREIAFAGRACYMATAADIYNRR